MAKQDIRIGIDLGGTKIEAIALNERGTELLRRRVPTPQGDYSATLQEIADLVHGIESELHCHASIGIGSPGAISTVTGKLKNSNSTCLNGKPLLQDLERVLQRSIAMANDADCLTLSEAVDGAGKDGPIVFGAILGTGVGGGISFNKQILCGPNAITGEWGHNPLPPGTAKLFRKSSQENRPCYCGRKDCIETYLSGTGLATSYKIWSGQTVRAEEIIARARQGEAAAAELLDNYCEQLAAALGYVINILDPHVIVLGGGMSNTSELYNEVPRRWTRYIFSDQVLTRLAKAQHGDSSGVRGAAWLQRSA